MAIVKTLTPVNPPAGVATYTLALPDNLFWVNELSWQPLTQAQERGIDGSLHVDVWMRRAGRPIELHGEGAWISRAKLRTLQAWAATAGLQFTLWWLDTSYQVMFDAGEDGTQAVQSGPIYPYSDISDADQHRGLTLRFLTTK